MLMTSFHFLRPYWLLALLLLFILAFKLWRQTPSLKAWSEVCDSHLLDHLVQNKGGGRRHFSLVLLLLSLLFMILSLAGPTWHQFPAATYKTIQPRVLVLDMSAHMMDTDLTPNRLSRAKYKLQDLLSRQNSGQVGLVVYTSEPFVVSPLTEDGATIASLLSVLNPEIMPVEGQNLEAALKEAANLIQQAGYHHGQILVLTSDAPDIMAIEKAKQLAVVGMDSSIMPVKKENNLNPQYQNFANAGQGLLLHYSSDSRDLDQWLKYSNTNQEYALDLGEDIPLWRDEGPWFLIPALFLLLPVFRRGWLQRVVL